MSTCEKCGSQDNGALSYGVCPVCRKKMLHSIPLVDFSKKDTPNKQSPGKKPLIPPQNLTLRIKNNMNKNKLGSASLILDLVALILIIIFLNRLIYASAFAIFGIICSIAAIESEYDDKLKLAGYGLLIGVILLVINFLPLILPIIQLFLLFW